MMLFLMLYKANKKAGGSRSDFLLKAAQIPWNLCAITL